MVTVQLVPLPLQAPVHVLKYVTVVGVAVRVTTVPMSYHWVQEPPVQLTSGPLDFSLPTASKDGKRLFVVGNLRRGELTRYDARTGQLVSYLSGPSIDWVSFSRDEQWMAYVIYPDLTLWRSKVDGTER